MVYTCYDMIRDCRAGEARGWRYFAANFAPIAQRLLDHYAPGDARNPARLERFFQGLRAPDSSVFQSTGPVPERDFLALLRQVVLAEIEAPAPQIPIGLEELRLALAPLTEVELQAVWLETMRYTAPQAATMLKISTTTVEKMRARGAEALRGAADSWSASMLADNGIALGREAGLGQGKDCPPAKAYLDILDGRSTWHFRESVDRQVHACFHCLDHFCRMVETIALVRDARPAEAAEAARYERLLGIEEAKRGVWQKVFGRT
jgi:DNA-directed RNA polymerase specialized sigma24 family protein